MYFLKLLGSLSFAIFLIASTLLFVIAGTWIESATQSHLFAAGLTYQNPIFQILLWLYFVNILFSALNRYPFRKKHIPFLLTHLGLLLLLLGVFIKNRFGIQGCFALSEGSASSEIFLANSYALSLETSAGGSLLPLKERKLGKLPSIHELELTLLSWQPHAEEHLEGFIKGKWGHVLGLPPFPVTQIGEPPLLAIPEYQIYAHQTNAVESISFPGRPSLFFLKDDDCNEQLVAFNQEGFRFTTPLKRDLFYIYDKGYGGYGISAQLPPNFPQIALETSLSRSWKEIPLPKKREEAKPCIKILAQLNGMHELITLSYDKYAQQFKWPILGGRYLVRFQSEKTTIPFCMRLLCAKQINYPGTDKPYSYEATIRIGEEEKTLSMNHVFEKKGFRFYLANLISSPSGISQVQIVVNHDPAKYFLTYPGGIILALGILLLFFSNPVRFMPNTKNKLE